MSLLIIKLLVDSVMIVLLSATIFYCVVVNRRIRVLQDSREEFAQLISKFDDSTRKAQESIEDLQKMSKRVTESLNERLDKANFLADDLAFMIEKGNKIADRVDKNLPRDERTPSGSVLPPKRESVVGRSAAAKNKADAAREPLLKAAGRDGAAGKEDRVESMLKRLGDKEAGKPRGAAGRRQTARLRSRAEQELHDALKSGND